MPSAQMQSLQLYSTIIKASIPTLVSVHNWPESEIINSDMCVLYDPSHNVDIKAVVSRSLFAKLQYHITNTTRKAVVAKSIHNLSQWIFPIVYGWDLEIQEFHK